MQMIEYLKALVLGIIEGITEWLPISSTGHIILANELLKMQVSAEFWNMFLVVIQLGAILAVLVLYFWKLWPLIRQNGQIKVKRKTLSMWGKILVSCVPAAIIGLLFDDKIDALFYNWQTISVMLILFGVLFILVEKRNHGHRPRCTSVDDLTYRAAGIIGLFQLIAAVFPGTSRSGATIIGALLIGVSRTVAAEYTFYLGVPVMFGASLLKLLKFGFAFTSTEAVLLLIGMVAAFAVSMLAIKFLMNYIKKHDFTVFGWYRIVLGALVILYFTLVH